MCLLLIEGHSGTYDRRSLLQVSQVLYQSSFYIYVLFTSSFSSDSLFTMMKDQYANYVVQKMLDIADLPQKKKLIQQMKPQLSNLKRYTYGKHIITKLDKIVQSLSMNGNI